MNFPVRSRDELLAVCQFLADFPCRWWLGGGWATDAWLGKQSRDHEDIEICIARSDQEHVLRQYATWQFFIPIDGKWSPLLDGQRLHAPDFMLQLQQTPQTQGVTSTMPPTFEFLLNQVQDEVWSFYHLPQLRLPISEVYTGSPWGMNVTKPELILLHKAVYQPRPKDELDFNALLPYLSQPQQHWLRDQIQAMHTNHPWIARLALEPA